MGTMVIQHTESDSEKLTKGWLPHPSVHEKASLGVRLLGLRPDGRMFAP